MIKKSLQGKITKLNPYESFHGTLLTTILIIFGQYFCTKIRILSKPQIRFSPAFAETDIKARIVLYKASEKMHHQHVDLAGYNSRPYMWPPFHKQAIELRDSSCQTIPANTFRWIRSRDNAAPNASRLACLTSPFMNRVTQPCRDSVWSCTLQKTNVVIGSKC